MDFKWSFHRVLIALSYLVHESNFILYVGIILCHESNIYLSEHSFTIGEMKVYSVDYELFWKKSECSIEELV